MKSTILEVHFQMKLQNSVGEKLKMTADSQKKSHHHHHHHHQHPHKKMVQIRSLERITNLPVVESAHAYYEKIKNSNALIKWSLMPAETGVWLAVGTAMPVVSYFEKPVTAVDSIFCMGLDVLEANLPMIKYPPDLVYNITKDYVTSKVVTPVMKRADSVKQLSINGANNFGELAANRLNNAIDVADKYVDKYLPDISDAPDSTDGPNPGSNPHPNSKRAKTIQHVNQFSRKLQRRLTRRTIAEARALKQQGADTLRSLVYLVNLLASDPKQFMEKARAMWLELSKDEPENQVPPANLEQLIEMLVREFARRVVHLSNYSYAKVIVLTHHGMEAAHIAACAAIYWANQVIKAMHLEPAIEKTATQVVKAHHASVEFVEKLVELLRNLKMEGLKVAEKRAILPVSEQPPQASQSTDSLPPQRTSSVSSVTSVTSYVSTASSNTITPSKPAHPSLNGETYTVYESKHEQVVS